MSESNTATTQGDVLADINLQVVSPSASVNRPLSFPTIPASTTVRQLKDKIRNTLAARPTDDQQRLIHRGRLLARDDETLEHIFGTEAVRSGEQQTLHLVLRDLSEQHHAPGQGTPLRGQSPTPANLPTRPPEGQQRPLNQQHPRPHPHIHPHAHQFVHAGQAYPPGNRPLTAPILQMPPGMLPIPFQPNGPFPPREPTAAQNHEHVVNTTHQLLAQMLNQQHPPRVATPVGSSRASPNPHPSGQDPTQVTQVGVQLALQLALIAQQQENLANHAEQVTIQLANQMTNQSPRGGVPAPQQVLHQGQLSIHHGHHLMGEAQQLIERSQRERAAVGLHGIQDNGQARNASGRNSPAIGQPVNVTREMVGPNGQYIRLTTTLGGQVGPGQNAQQGTAIPGRGPLLPNEIQNIIRGAEASQATQAMTNAMHRSASGVSLAPMANVNAPVQPIAPGVTTSIFQNASRHGSRTATPDPSQRISSQANSSVPASAQNTGQGTILQERPEVYIMSSPTGPTAVLITDHDTYFTPPAVRPYPLYAYSQRIPGMAAPQVQAQAQGQQNQPQNQARLRQNNPGWRRRGAARVANGEINPAINLHQHMRPPIGVAVLGAVWPHIWLLIRLAAFVWWFTATDSSWSRWLTVVLIAIGVFAVNTGMLNGVANQAWDPFRRHLEGILLPVAGPNNRNAGPLGAAQGQRPAGEEAARDNNQHIPAAPATGGQQQTAQRAGHENPDPAQAAARLVAQRRNNNANWLMEQIRRVERAGLLFLASIAPGVAERHIAHLEAQERNAAQERARREAEERQDQETPAVHGNQAEVQVQDQEQGRGQEPAQEAVDAQRQEGPLIQV